MTSVSKIDAKPSASILYYLYYLRCSSQKAWALYCITVLKLWWLSIVKCGRMLYNSECTKAVAHCIWNAFRIYAIALYKYHRIINMFFALLKWSRSLFIMLEHYAQCPMNQFIIYSTSIPNLFTWEQ